MTNFSNKLKKPCSWPIFSPIFLGRKFARKSGSVTHNFTWDSSTMPNFRKTNDTIPRKSLGRRKGGRTDRRMNRPYFIGLFGLLGGGPTSIYQITLRRLCSQILSFYFSSFISKDNHVLVEKHNPLEKSYDSQERTR